MLVHNLLLRNNHLALHCNLLVNVMTKTKIENIFFYILVKDIYSGEIFLIFSIYLCAHECILSCVYNLCITQHAHTYMQISLTCMFQLSEGIHLYRLLVRLFLFFNGRTCSLHLHCVNNALGYVNYPALTTGPRDP